MSDLLFQVLKYDDTNIEIIEKAGTRYWSANDLHKSSGCKKQLVKFFSSEQYGDLLEGAKDYYSSDVKKSTSLLNPLIQKKGNFADGSRQGTWIHEDLVVGFARWCNAKFSFWCDMKV